MTSKEKNKFRTTKEWREFRLKLLKERGAQCQLCGCKYVGVRKKMIQVHHLDPSNYTILNPTEFKLLCSGCHSIVELMERRLVSSSSDVLNREEWMTLLTPYLAHK